jgi:uncharacterized membrane protein
VGFVGLRVGCDEGRPEGCLVGWPLGCLVGCTVGFVSPVVGITVGWAEGSLLGAGVANVGLAEGTGDGAEYVGERVGHSVG